jgi:hypothetical protein
LFLSIGGAGADLYYGYRMCFRERNALDLHLLKKKKLQLMHEKELLLIQKEAWVKHFPTKDQSSTSTNS